eukprot:scaffold6004_cov229-Pinguiococcus_pyrenoidosus.AAC.5
MPSATPSWKRRAELLRRPVREGVAPRLRSLSPFLSARQRAWRPLAIQGGSAGTCRASGTSLSSIGRRTSSTHHNFCGIPEMRSSCAAHHEPGHRESTSGARAVYAECAKLWWAPGRCRCPKL